MQIDSLSGRKIKELKTPCGWGSQDGLLSPAELTLLMWRIAAWRRGPVKVLEVGHYYGLSTCAIVHALKWRGSNWYFETWDNHKWCKSVGLAPELDFIRNMRAAFDDPRCRPITKDSQEIVSPIGFDIVFYDGDHGAEQVRFTESVIRSPDVELFIFDDWDWKFPKECSAALCDAGWENEFPVNDRGPLDKESVGTQALSIWRSPNAS